ncbi:MAG: hypothetical protein OXD48_12395, partial [Litoreibacter sp.]|nr:hypothetical protein [Litoreibacter sp.]
WWKSRKCFRAYSVSFYELIEAVTSPIVNDLKDGQVEDIRRMALEELEEFISEQAGILTDISNKSQISFTELKDLYGITKQEERDSLFEILFEEFAVEEPAETAEPEEPSDAPVRPERPTSIIRAVNEGDAA